ncbi:MAG: alkaline phosphatase family protein [Hyphomonas sp.]|nr:alkaline phosphatase family protein [Hyphomonas sp.]
MAPSLDHAILFGFDGLRPDSINDADCPNLKTLLDRATVLTRHRSVFPTVTRVNLASLVTGACPNDHGVVANAFFLRGSDRTEPFDTARLNDLTTLDTVGHLDAFRAMHVSNALEDGVGGLAVLATGSIGSFNLLSGFCNDPDRVFNPRVHCAHESGFAGGGANWPMETVKHFVSNIWPRRRPRLSILWFAEADSAGHESGVGSPAHRAAIKAIDGALGHIIEWRNGQQNADRIGIAVASDHGQVSVSGSISLVNWLGDQGFRAGTQWQDALDVVVIPGMSAFLWQPSSNGERVQAIIDRLVGQAWCGPVFTAQDRFGPLRGSFDLADVALRHPAAPDAVVTFCGDDRTNTHGCPGLSPGDLTGSMLEIGSGHHGGLHATELACLCAFEGNPFPAERRNVPSCTANIVPTLCAALGIEATFPAPRLPILDGPAGDRAAPAGETQSVRVGSVEHQLDLWTSGPVTHVDALRTTG